jgi:hypothetical protein
MLFTIETTDFRNLSESNELYLRHGQHLYHDEGQSLVQG